MEVARWDSTLLHVEAQGFKDDQHNSHKRSKINLDYKTYRKTAIITQRYKREPALIMNVIHKSNILIVDDSAANRSTACRVLETLDNIHFIHADSGESALALLLRHPVAAILLDINMPGLNGYETATAISNDSDLKNTPIIMVTAQDSSPAEVISAYDAGAQDYITKPIEPVILLNKVRHFVALDQAIKKSAFLHQQRDRILNTAAEGVLEINKSGFILYCNEKACSLFGSPRDCIIGTEYNKWFKLAEGQEDSAGDHFEVLYQTVLQQGVIQRNNLEACIANNQTIPVEINCSVNKNDHIKSMTLLFQNISKRLEMEGKLQTMANIDSLTGLGNRCYFHNTLRHTIKRQQRLAKDLAVLFLDLDHFKYINDSYGHHTGDELLKKVGERLNHSVRKGDLVARMGGDEFAIVLYDIRGPKDITVVANKIIQALSEPMDIDKHLITTSVSIGIALLKKPSTDIEELLKQADIAMYQAKTEGRNNYRFFMSEIQEKESHRQRLKALLQQAISNDELSIVYQPKFSMSAKRVVGCEALLRWNPTGAHGASIPPNEFIPIAEESGQINAIGDWVVNKVFKQVKRWLSYPGFKDMSVSLNVSIRQLQNPEFAHLVEGLIKKYCIPPEVIEFEVTETGTVQNMERVISALQSIHALGIKISIDDFGTGHASLDHLRKLPFDILKIDRSFIKDIGVDAQNEELIRVVMAIAKAMNLEVIAEGVETKSQLAFLDDIDCDLIQGFYFSKPISASEFTLPLHQSTIAPHPLMH